MKYFIISYELFKKIFFKLILIDSFYIQTNFLSFLLISYFKATTPLLGFFSKTHTSNKITFISNYYLHLHNPIL